MLPGTVRHSDSEKERCGPGTKDKQKSCRTAFPGPEFVLFLHREDFSRHTGLRGVRAGCRRHLRAAAAHDAVPAAGRGPLGSLLAAALRVASGAPLFRRVYPQLPRKPRHTAARQGRFHSPNVGHDASSDCSTGDGGRRSACWPWPSASRGTSSRSQRCASDFPA